MMKSTKLFSLFFVVHNYSGAASYTRELFRYLDKEENVELFIVYLENNRYPQFTVETQGRLTLFYFPPIKTDKHEKYATRILDLLMPWISPDRNIIFHLNHPYHSFLGKVARERLKVKIVYTLHFLPDFFSCSNVFEENKIEAYDYSHNREVIEVADKVIAVTRFARDVVCHYYKKKECELIYNGFGNEEIVIPIPTEEKSLLKQKLGFKNEMIILFVGRIDETKGCDKLIQAFLSMAEKYDHLRLVIAGNGNYAQCLKLIGNRCGKISFTGFLGTDQLKELYQIADIGVLPSLWEQCSYVALEMMAYGVPIVYSSVEGLKELFEDGKKECTIPLVFDKKEKYRLSIMPQDIEKALATLCDHIELRNRMKEFVRTRWKQNYTSEKMGQKTWALYQSLF